MQIIKVKNAKEGIIQAKSLLYKYCNSQTALFLSGGSTPKALYQTLSKEQKLKVGVVAIVDERYGEKLHEGSNEKMMGETGLFKYLNSSKIPTYRILNGKDIDSTTKTYEQIIFKLIRSYKQKIAILGIGEDGHIAGILPKSLNQNIQTLVTKIDDFGGEFRQRITLTFKALSEMDRLIVLVFGENKKRALQQMFKKGIIEEIPARFFTKKEISQKTVLITDIKNLRKD